MEALSTRSDRRMVHSLLRRSRAYTRRLWGDIKWELLGNTRIKWVLIYGAPRTGTSLMTRLASHGASRLVHDWCLWDVLKLTPEFSYLNSMFDRKRAARDVCRNVLDNAVRTSGSMVDLLFKQAEFHGYEYECLAGVWGRPYRTIFCFREPCGYLASVQKKFSWTSLGNKEKVYLESFALYERIGGEPFEYSSHRTMSEYIDFLGPLVSSQGVSEEFRFRGSFDVDNVTDEMWAAYHEFKAKYRSTIFTEQSHHPAEG